MHLRCFQISLHYMLASESSGLVNLVSRETSICIYIWKETNRQLYLFSFRGVKHFKSIHRSLCSGRSGAESITVLLFPLDAQSDAFRSKDMMHRTWGQSHVAAAVLVLYTENADHDAPVFRTLSTSTTTPISTTGELACPNHLYFPCN